MTDGKKNIQLSPLAKSAQHNSNPMGDARRTPVILHDDGKIFKFFVKEMK